MRLIGNDRIRGVLLVSPWKNQMSSRMLPVYGRSLIPFTTVLRPYLVRGEQLVGLMEDHIEIAAFAQGSLST